ncbi:MAG: lytic transglycosylase domain-containing protein [Rhizomicrobium sp.]
MRIANLPITMCVGMALLMAGGDALASVKRGAVPAGPKATHALTATTPATRNTDDVKPADVEILRRALELAHRHDWVALRTMTKSDAGVEDLLRWLTVSDETSGASFDEIDGFLHSNPDWPRQERIQSFAEKRMPRTLGAPAVLAWFAGREPETGIGSVRLGEAEIALGNQKAGSARIQHAWLAASFDRASELEVLADHGALLPKELQDARLARLLYGSDEAAIARQLARASHGAVQKATLRLLLQKNPREGLAQFAGHALKDDPNVLFDAACAYRQLAKPEESRALLLRVARSDDPSIARLRVWSEIVLDTGDALKEHAYQDAYDLVSAHHLEPGSEFADAEFLAGWIALTYLSKPDVALHHFEALQKNVSRPISVARAEYWTGRAFDALKKKDQARKHYEIASRKPETFYGQLALTRLESHPVLRLASEPSVSAAPLAKDTRAEAFRLLAAAGAKGLAREFALRITADELTTAKAAALIAMANAAGDHVLALRIAKHAEYQDVIVTDALNPTAIAGLPSDDLSIPKADLLALVRQESEFEPGAVSTAGARGLMQLMPAAAKERAKTLGLPYSLSRLTSDAGYNVKLGTTHFRAFFEAWRGSYVLAIASYNAGAGNVRKWIATYGDPRNPSVDVVDWIEAIPFAETRNYVQRVIENIEVYRSRLAGGSQPLDILNTLDHSGGAAPLAAVATVKLEPRHQTHRTVKARRTKLAANER